MYIGRMIKQPINILATEDNETTRKIIARFLLNMGYKADFAKDGEEAIELFLKETYDLVFMDLKMPKMDGITAVDHMKAHIASTDKTYPFFVALTQNVAPADEKRFHEVGFDRTVMKPVSPEKLRNSIEIALQRKIYIESLPSKLNRNFAKDFPLNALVVDDEPINGRVTMKYLEALGYQPKYVSNGYEAIEIVRDNQYHIILMDIRMPEIDGFSTTDVIREHFYLKKCALMCPSIVALTSIEMIESQRSYRDGMFDNHIVKPIQIEKLASILYIAHQRKLLFASVGGKTA